jgi:hypothetical protein
MTPGSPPAAPAGSGRAYRTARRIEAWSLKDIRAWAGDEESFTVPKALATQWLELARRGKEHALELQKHAQSERQLLALEWDCFNLESDYRATIDALGEWLRTVPNPPMRCLLEINARILYAEQDEQFRDDARRHFDVTVPEEAPDARKWLDAHLAEREGLAGVWTSAAVTCGDRYAFRDTAAAVDTSRMPELASVIDAAVATYSDVLHAAHQAELAWRTFEQLYGGEPAHRQALEVFSKRHTAVLRQRDPYLDVMLREADAHQAIWRARRPRGFMARLTPTRSRRRGCSGRPAGRRVRRTSGSRGDPHPGGDDPPGQRGTAGEGAGPTEQVPA